MAEITARGRIPLLVGGTFLYFRALQYGLSDMPAADPAIRARLEAEASRDGWEALHARLATADPESAARIHTTDPQRIQRALEVYEITGKSMSALHAQATAHDLPYRVLKLALIPADRQLLHAQITARFQQMLADGLLEEVNKLYKNSEINADLPAMRAVGYRQLWCYLSGQLEYESMVEQAIIATRQYAKRQLTWLRGEPDLERLAAGDSDILDRVCQKLDQLTLKNAKDCKLSL
jgi:tRNA dimethylallyltransferase